MASPLAIPTTLDTFALNTALADYQRQLIDNVYNAVVWSVDGMELGVRDAPNATLFECPLTLRARHRCSEQRYGGCQA